VTKIGMIGIMKPIPDIPKEDIIKYLNG